jgi:GT2 family glycosyltransferase
MQENDHGIRKSGSNPAGLAICIATHRRPRQLEKLIRDLALQTILPDTLAVVDGDPASGEIRELLRSTELFPRTEIVYIPSNHASLPYQRYLGWRLCSLSRYLLYLDDDLRIPQCDFVDRITRPLRWNEGWVSGVTCLISFGDPGRLGPGNFQTTVLDLTASGPKPWRKLMNLGRIPAGHVSPSGHRRMPARCADYAPVEWLSGCAMAFRTGAISSICFPESGFALFKARLGTGEDLVLARHVREKGPLLFAYCAEVEHPYDTPTNFGPQDFFRLGLTYAFGERYVNDNHRGSGGPSPADRMALARSLLGTTTLNWFRFLRKPAGRRLHYAWGFTLGTFRALAAFPTPAALFPQVDWKRDAESALRNCIAFESCSTTQK